LSANVEREEVTPLYATHRTYIALPPEWRVEFTAYDAPQIEKLMHSLWALKEITFSVKLDNYPVVYSGLALIDSVNGYSYGSGVPLFNCELTVIGSVTRQYI
jgi:hypothetical protein